MRKEGKRKGNFPEWNRFKVRTFKGHAKKFNNKRTTLEMAKSCWGGHFKGMWGFICVHWERALCSISNACLLHRMNTHLSNCHPWPSVILAWSSISKNNNNKKILLAFTHTHTHF